MIHACGERRKCYATAQQKAYGILIQVAFDDHTHITSPWTEDKSTDHDHQDAPLRKRSITVTAPLINEEGDSTDAMSCISLPLALQTWVPNLATGAVHLHSFAKPHLTPIACTANTWAQPGTAHCKTALRCSIKMHTSSQHHKMLGHVMSIAHKRNNVNKIPTS